MCFCWQLSELSLKKSDTCTLTPKTVTTMPSCEKQLSYHVPHQSQLNTQSSGLSPRTPSLLENPLTFFTNTRTSPFTMLPSVLFYKEGLYIFMQHSSKHWRGSPFTGLPHHHLVRVGVNTSILILIVSILLYFLATSLFNSVCHTAIWAQIANCK
jgi:hypothetical protein